MSQTAARIDAVPLPIEQRVDNLVAAHGGDLRATIVTILELYDQIYDRVSRGYVRVSPDGDES